MYPSQIRERMLREHAQVRDELASIDAAAFAVLERGGDGRAIREGATRLDRVLGGLHDREQAMLDPALREADAWGDVRVRQLRRLHGRQRGAARALREAAEAGTLGTVGLARELRRVVAEVRAALDEEARRFLNADLLRDDLVYAAQSDG